MKKSQLRIGVVLSYLNEGLGNIIPIFYTPIMLSLLGTSEYGLYKIAGSVTSYLSLVSLGVGGALNRYLIKARVEKGKDAEERILGMFVMIFRIISIVAFIIGILISFNIHFFYGHSLTSFELSRMKVLIIIMTINTALSFSMTPYVSEVSAHEEFFFLQSMNIITTCIGPLVNLLVLFLGFASIGMAFSSLTLGVIVRLLYYFYVRFKLDLKAQFKSLPTYLLKEIMLFSFWVFLGNIVNQLHETTDTVLIGMVPGLSTTGAAVYNVGAAFNHMVFSAAVTLSTLLTPRTNKMVFSGATNTELTDYCIRMGRIQAYIVSLIVTGFVSFGQAFLDFYVGPKYSEAYWVAVFMMVPSMIPLIQSVCTSIVVAKNRHRFRSIVFLLMAILNVIGTWFLMKKWGISGAAFMTGATSLLGSGIIMNWFFLKKIGLEIGRFWRETGVIYIIPILMSALTIIVSRFVNFHTIKNFFIGVIVYTCLFCVFNWAFIFNQREKDMVMDIFRTFKIHGHKS